MIIAIDGPAGSGKTTIAKSLAKKLGILYLDTGATYRALTLKILNSNVSLDDEDSIERIANNLNVNLVDDKVFLDDEDVTAKIRTPLIDKSISKPVSFPGVRQFMVRLQRNIVKSRDAVVEGRDITTVVFPSAEFKFYLDAQLSQRANRRYEELKKRGVNMDFKELEADMARRDDADFNREAGPLKKAIDAIIFDTTRLSIDEVLSGLVKYIKND